MSKINEISIETNSRNNQSNDENRPSIKPSLHVISYEDMSKKLSQNFQTNQQNSHLMPFKVNHNQLMPYLSHLSSFTSIDFIKPEDNRLLEANDRVFINSSRLRPDSCPPIHSVNENYENNQMNGFNKTNSIFSLNSCEMDSIHEREDNSFESNFFPITSRPLSKSVSQSNPYQYFRPLEASVLRSTTNERNYESCPSSPLMNRFQYNSSYDVKQSEPINSTKLMRSQYLINNGFNFHRLHGSDVFLNED